MSFLSILLVASAFYFAHARPDSQSWSEPFGAAQSGDQAEAEPAASAVPDDSSAPITDPKDYQHKLYGFMNEMSEAVEKYITPLMSELDVKKQDELKNMGMNGFASYVNYLCLLIQEIKNEKGDGQTESHGDSFPRNEMILQFESPYPLDPNTPYMADTEIGDDEDEEE